MGMKLHWGSGGRNRSREVTDALGGGYSGDETWETRVSETWWLKDVTMA